MSKIANAFKGGNGKAFIPFITCGDPSLEVTEQLVYAMEEAGANLIELGIPFSDPTAEGPVIQAANTRALSGGVTTDKIFAMVKKIRKNTQIPMVFMTYANVVFSYGTERFIKKASELGMDGLILPDVPYEEKEEFDSVCKKYDMDLISLIATDLPRAHQHDRERGIRFCILRILSWRYRNEKRDHNGYRRDGRACEEGEGHPVRGWFRNLHTGAGKEDGRSLRRSYRWFRNREALRNVWKGRGSVCERVCEVHV